MSITKMFFARVIAPALSSLVRKPKVVFPKKIGSWEYKRRFYPKTFNGYAFAIYKNPSGKKAMAKSWSGAVRDFAYYTLKNELNILKTLNCALGRVNNSIPDKYSNIHIPTLLRDVETKGNLTVLKKFVRGTKATSLDTAEKFDIYLRSNDFLEYLGEKLTETEKKNISNRDALSIVILYPIFLIKALLTNHQASWNLISGIPLFLRSVPIFLKHKSQFFGDRDLVLDNILVSGKEIYLIDLQFGMFSEPLYDEIYRSCVQWYEEDFRLLLLEHVKSRSKKYGKNLEILLKGLMIHVATHALTVNNLSKRKTKSSLDFLTLATEGEF